jgi:hypothetical protein
MTDFRTATVTSTVTKEHDVTKTMTDFSTITHVSTKTMTDFETDFKTVTDFKTMTDTVRVALELMSDNLTDLTRSRTSRR